MFILVNIKKLTQIEQIIQYDRYFFLKTTHISKFTKKKKARERTYNLLLHQKQTKKSILTGFQPKSQRNFKITVELHCYL